MSASRPEIFRQAFSVFSDSHFRSDDPSILKVSSSDNAYMSCETLQKGHCFTVEPVVIFAEAGDYQDVVHKALEQWKVSGDWFVISLSEACNAICVASTVTLR